MKRVIDHSGCKSCPAYPKCTVAYRGSACAALRDTYGLGDPMTNAQKIRAMSDEELAGRMEAICISSICGIVCGGECNALPSLTKSASERCKEIILEWLQQPYKEDA